MTLKELRESVNMTQAEVAEKMGATQAEVSRIEKRTDHKVSTLRKYMAALGGRVEFRARFADNTYRLGGK